MLRRLSRIARILVQLLLVASGLPPPALAAFTAFESGQVRGLALSSDGTRLYALNTPDNRLEIFEVSGAGLLHLSSVGVGLEPVAVAERVPGEVWVVNQLSDDVSIVSTVGTPRVVRTLLVGDEPMDVVFAGDDPRRAFVTCARRGQNNPVPADSLTPGIGRALVFVYDTAALGQAAGGEPLAVLVLFGDAPRALAVSPDGSRVYAAILRSGNRTTAIPASVVTSEGVTLLPSLSVDGKPAPPVSQIVRFDDTSGQWRDDEGRDWSAFVPFSLPDLDVFSIDATASPAGMQTSIVPFGSVGTVLFNMAVNPADGNVFVTNSEARNEVRFEGAGAALAAFPQLPQRTVRGRLHEYRVTVIDPVAETVEPRHLNKHIDYSLTPAQTAATDTADRSLATPLGLAIDSTGSKLYVAAYGSSKVGVFSPAAIEDDSFTPSESDHVEISGGGPSSLALDEPRSRLYVLARFGRSISVVDTTVHPGSEIAVVPLPYDPEPASVRNGRKFLYDARLTSSNGEASCSSCHVFGSTDGLAWNLGDPDAASVFSSNRQAILAWTLDNLDNIDDFFQGAFLPDGFFLEHHPLKGPMFTQNMRGLANHGPMHWRGERSAAVSGRENAATLDEIAALNAFNPAFASLLGRTAPLSSAEMQALTDFLLQVVYPPNPMRRLDNALTPAQTNARNIFLNTFVHPTVSTVPPTFKCSDCHTLDAAAGFFGTSGFSSFRTPRTQVFKVPHLRNLYSFVGMFGIPGSPAQTGPQIRGFGYQHDGTVDTVLSFITVPELLFPGANETERQQNRLDMVDFLLAFDTESAPVLGQQVTLDASGPATSLLAGSGITVDDRIALLVSRALVTTPRPECDLIVKGEHGGTPRGWWMSGAGAFTPDKGGAPAATLAELVSFAQAPGAGLTFFCVPPGSGTRLGVDRNDDGIRDVSQCGDVNLDGVVARNDSTLVRRALAGLPGSALPLVTKCNVRGAADLSDSNHDGVPADCNILDAAVLARTAAALAPGVVQGCVAAQTCASDGDSDTICTAVDNCPTVANARQQDGDGDGVGDACDACPADPANDADGDGVCVGADNCPAIANPSQANADGDLLGDDCDACPVDPANDADGDGLCANADNCPGISNPSQANADGDALGDACDACPADPGNDGDLDGVCAAADNCPAIANPGQQNGDGDALGDACDACPADPGNDDDGDGVCAAADNCPAIANPGQQNGDGDALGDACDACPADPGNDGDGDGFCANADNCPAIANPSQANADGDLLGDDCDACPVDPANDADGDGLCANVDNCPGISNPSQANADGDGLGDACDACPADPGNDGDGDGVCAAADNCPAIANPGQENGDGDGLGDACDACPADPGNDGDGDGVCAAADNCPAIANPGQANGDGDGLGDACDACPADPGNDGDGDGVCAAADNCPAIANPGQQNGDGDALGDACDACPADPGNDDDGDGVCAAADNCPAIANPGQQNGDGDALGDACDACPVDPANDDDGDGLCANADNCPAIANPGQQNGDGDALGDACDACPADPGNDGDGDGVCAAADNCPAVANASQANSDGDALGDACDACPADPGNDGDGDGVCAPADNCPAVANASQANQDGDALGDACDACPADPANDVDTDGVCGDVDNCPAIANASQANQDGDALGDACDACPADPANDVDIDGVCGDVDNCPAIPNPGQEDEDLDLIGDACDSCPSDPGNDPDVDGVCAITDNCPAIANPGQADGDGDTLGDACDACPTDPGNDVDLDGVCAPADNCPAMANAGQENADGDALGDVCDACPADPANDVDTDGVCGDVDNCPANANASQANQDGDALGDACDACPADPANDADTDGVCGNVDNCPAIANSGQQNGDGDALGDACDACPTDPGNDVDLDGVCAAADNCPAIANPGQENGDGDALGDACDPCPADPLDQCVPGP